MTILFFILILIVLILVHEFGHFIIAKAFGIKVHEFGIFFPPRLFAKKFGETEYSFNLLPFGGFVKIFGENYDEGKDDPRSFVNKPRWQQAAVLVAGIAFNLLFAWLALTVGYMAGLPTATEHKGFGYVQGAAPTVVVVLPSSPAQKAGLIEGDRVEKIETAHEALDARTLNTSRQAEVVPARTPGPQFYPVSAIDYCTGYLMAFGAMVALARRAREGGSWLVRISLAQTGRWLVGRGEVPERDLTDIPTEFTAAEIERWSMTSDTPAGRLHHLAPVVRLSETPPRWARPSVPLGYHAPAWPARSA